MRTRRSANNAALLAVVDVRTSGRIHTTRCRWISWSWAAGLRHALDPRQVYCTANCSRVAEFDAAGTAAAVNRGREQKSDKYGWLHFCTMYFSFALAGHRGTCHYTSLPCFCFVAYTYAQIVKILSVTDLWKSHDKEFLNNESYVHVCRVLLRA